MYLEMQLLLIKALWYSCTLAPPCIGTMSRYPLFASCGCLDIVTSQWVFTVMSLHNCYAPHFTNGAVTSALGKQHFVRSKFEQNFRLLIFK